MNEYACWRQYGPDLTPLGLHRGSIDPDNRYFCTPIGAVVFGWSGLDGIHFCKIRRFREMIFAVSPMNGPGEYVHPIARDFHDFLRLLITLGDTAMLEQAWMWDRSRFMSERKAIAAGEDPARMETIRKLTKKFSLTPIEDPYNYIHTLQEKFDYTAIPFQSVFAEACMPQPPLETLPWQVVCAPGFFPRTTRQQRSTEYPVRLPFTIPLPGSEPVEAQVLSYYICHKGMVIDLFISWEISDRSVIPTLTANNRILHASFSSVCTNLPDPEGSDTETNSEAKAVFSHYGLCDRRGQIHRLCFLWKSGGWHQEPALKSCILTLEISPHFSQVAEFTVRQPGDSVAFTDSDGNAHILTVTSWNREDTALPSFTPLYLYAMGYTIDPPLEKKAYILSDVSKFDYEAVKLSLSGGQDNTAIGMIGGADGPTALFISDPAPYVVYSAVRAEPFTTADWSIQCRETEISPVSIVLFTCKKESQK